ncbi:alpha/beta fold hydrolase, partial [bacterium]|nr:alpha/beta fold hydrolase [bacterium]
MKFQTGFCGLLLLTFAAIAYGQGTVVDDSFYSNALGETRMVDVYLPEGYYGDTTRYNVIYFLHGAGGNQDSYEFLIGILDSLIGNGIIEPVIVVKPDGTAGPFQNSMYTNSELNGAVEDYIVVDLIGYIDSHYRTRTSRDKRVIMGHSMGGVGTMRLGLKHPDLFRGWASHCCRINPEPDDFWISHVLTENGGSGPYDPNAGWFTRGAYSMAAAYSPNLDNPPYFVDFPLDNDGNWVDSTHAKWLLQYPACNPPLEPDVYSQAIYFDCGTQDELGNYPTNLAFIDTLNARSLAYEFQSFDGGHSNQLPYRFP